MKKKVTGLIGFALVSVMIAGCGKTPSASTDTTPAAAASANQESGAGEAPAEGSISLTWASYKGDWADAYEKIFEIYRADHPEIKEINVYTANSSEFSTNLKAMLAAGTLPNVFNLSTDVAGKEWKEYLQEVSDTAAAKNVKAEYLDPYTWDGGVYGVTYNYEIHGTVWNIENLEKVGYDDVPRTRSEMEDAVAKLEAAGLPGGLDLITNTHLLYDHLGNVPLYLNNDDAVVAYNDLVAGNVDLVQNQGWNEYFDWMMFNKDHAVDDVFQIDKTTGEMNLYNEQYSYYTTGGTNLAASSQQYNESWVTKYRIGPYCVNDTDDPYYTVNIQGFALSNTSDEATNQAARELFDWFFTSPEVAQILTEEVGCLPVVENFEITEDMVDEYSYAAIEDVANHNSHVMRALTNASVNNEIVEKVQRFLSGDMSREDALAALGEAYATYGDAY